MASRMSRRTTLGALVALAAVIASLAYRLSPGAVPYGSATAITGKTASINKGDQTQGPRGGVWQLVFDSQFKGRSLDTSQWSTGFFGPGVTVGANFGEQECYGPGQVRVAGGLLDITAVERTSVCGGRTMPFLSGMVMTYPKFSFTYGYLEARIWLPRGPEGIADWPAFWAFGQEHSEAKGEIDVLEGVRGHACVHFISVAGGRGHGACATANMAGAWHTFAAEWEPGSVTFYFDGSAVYRDTHGITSSPMYLVLNLALETAMTSPDTAPATMEVSYVKVWQHPKAAHGQPGGTSKPPVTGRTRRGKG